MRCPRPITKENVTTGDFISPDIQRLDPSTFSGNTGQGPLKEFDSLSLCSKKDSSRVEPAMNVSVSGAPESADGFRADPRIGFEKFVSIQNPRREARDCIELAERLGELLEFLVRIS